jgi:hypothetical protein
MKTVRRFCAVAVAALLMAPAAQAQQPPPKPGPEHELLKKWEGTWDTTMKLGGMETKGTATYKMEVGGMWLVSNFEGEFGGAKFYGKGLDSYDANKKKYVGIWCDSMSASPLLMEGTFNKEKKTLTMSGMGPGEDGKPVKFTAVSEWKDENTVNFSMFMADAKEPGFTIVYKRRK